MTDGYSAMLSNSPNERAKKFFKIFSFFCSLFDPCRVLLMNFAEFKPVRRLLYGVRTS